MEKKLFIRINNTELPDDFAEKHPELQVLKSSIVSMVEDQEKMKVAERTTNYHILILPEAAYVNIRVEDRK